MTEQPKTTLTRQQLLSSVGKPRYEEVELDGLGTVGIRQRTRLQESRRTFALFDANGKVDATKAALQPFWRLIDQVMTDETTPMFTESDVELLASMPEGELEPLFVAIQQFNEQVETPKKTEGSNDSSES